MRVKKSILFLIIVSILISSFPVMAAEVKPMFYVEHRAVSQESTAYLSKPGQYPAAPGGTYRIGIVSVHPRYKGAAYNDPIIDFGTMIWLESPSSITIQGTAYNHFDVMDTGDLNYSYHPNSPYWIDIYFGQWNGWDKTDPDHVAATKYGNAKKVTYTWDTWE